MQKILARFACIFFFFAPTFLKSSLRPCKYGNHEDIPAQLILNWDQTGIKIVPSTTWTMNQRGVKGVNDKRQITAVFCCSLVGDFLPVQIIYAGKTARCHPKFNFRWTGISHTPRM